MGISRQGHYKRDRVYRTRVKQGRQPINFLQRLCVRQRCIGPHKLRSLMQAERDKQERHVGRDRLFEVLRDHQQEDGTGFPGAAECWQLLQEASEARKPSL